MTLQNKYNIGRSLLVSLWYVIAFTPSLITLAVRDLKEGYQCFKVYLEQSSEVLYRGCSNSVGRCKDINTYFPNVCPFHKGGEFNSLNYVLQNCVNPATHSLSPYSSTRARTSQVHTPKCTYVQMHCTQCTMPMILK